METEVKETKEVKTEKKKQPLTSFKDIDISNPKLYDNELDIYLRNEGKSIYKVPKRYGTIYYVVGSDNTVKVCAVKSDN